MPCVHCDDRACGPRVRSWAAFLGPGPGAALVLAAGATALALALAFSSGTARASRDGPAGASQPLTSFPWWRDAEALLALKAALNNHPAFNGLAPGFGDSYLPIGAWTIRKGQEALSSPCGPFHWAWVGCNARGRVVSVLDDRQLSGVNSSWAQGGKQPLTGHIPWKKLAGLQFLRSLDVSFQAINGTLNGVGVLTSLTGLDLADNAISGPVPDEISKLSNLQALRVEANKLSGELPRSLSTLTKLSTLSLGGNSFIGAFPPWLSNLRNLQLLDLSSNNFSSRLPVSWSSLTYLSQLQLQFTSVEGTLPHAWSTMIYMMYISCHSCGIKSMYPHWLTKLPYAMNIGLSNNQLYGPLPTNLTVSALASVDLGSNYFNGSFPTRPNAHPESSLRAENNCFSDHPTGYNPRPAASCKAFYTTLGTRGAIGQKRSLQRQKVETIMHTDDVTDAARDKSA